MTKWLLRAMTELSSRKWISKLTGKFAESSASRMLIPRFAKIYGINVKEAEKELSQYATLNEFFTRRLKPDARHVHESESALVSPVDALITGAGVISKGAILNVKGQNYTIDELLNGSPRTTNYMDGYYYVLYLSPTDYHRIHMPVSGQIVERELIPGKVYPVNNFGLQHMKRVLSRNERLVTYVKHHAGEAAVVKVGAMNVSSIQYVMPLRERMDRGDELAYFRFGSTVVLLTEDDSFIPRDDLHPGMKVRMGERLGDLVER
ncbi:archaetidylserine decarboxylase [Paenibacillus chungangensis]|uniref:Phosphatidylserine decarboxylase proenzyme n=1 Tax=Paenibacillus chungangensis TaxID=696535 RepID=A0ABW3HXH4_9BACL